MRLDAPLMSFGSVKVDQRNGTDDFPYRAMLTGLFANALGLVRADADAHDLLQSGLRYAARRDQPGELLVDFQTVDFDPAGPSASHLGWTTWGRIEERKGGEASEGTHIRERHYLAGAVITAAVAFKEVPGSPFTLAGLEAALNAPARPLFLGRKCCIPSRPLVVGMIEADSLRHALELAPRDRRAEPGPLSALWPLADGLDSERSATVARVEDRDWANDIHVGRRLYVEGLVHTSGVDHV